MKTVAKIKLYSVSLLLISLVAVIILMAPLARQALAQTNSPSNSPPMVSPPPMASPPNLQGAMPAPPPPPPSMPGPSTSVMPDRQQASPSPTTSADVQPRIVPPAAGSDVSGKGTQAGLDSGISMGGSGDDKDDKDSDQPSKVPESVKNVISHLSSTSHDVTLEDLNAAREAVAKLDALIDIEKRLSDLENIRQERAEKSGKALAAAIPASALGMPNHPNNYPPAIPASFTPSFGGAPKSLALPVAPSEPLVVERVEGGDGRYTAFIKEDGDSKLTPVHVGDKLPDGSKVIAITAQGVEVEKDKTTNLVPVKDVTTVFGNR